MLRIVARYAAARSLKQVKTKPEDGDALANRPNKK
jgi:hypothetical protein